MGTRVPESKVPGYFSHWYLDVWSRIPDNLAKGYPVILIKRCPGKLTKGTHAS